MTKAITPGMMFVDKITRAIRVVTVVDRSVVHFLNVKNVSQITFSYKQITFSYEQEHRDNFEFLVNHYYELNSK